MLFQNLKAISEERSEICVLFCKYIYIFIYIDRSAGYFKITVLVTRILQIAEKVTLKWLSRYWGCCHANRIVSSPVNSCLNSLRSTKQNHICTRLGSARLESTRLISTRLDSLDTHSFFTLFTSARLDKYIWSTVRIFFSIGGILSCTRLGSARLDSARFDLTRVYSVDFLSPKGRMAIIQNIYLKPTFKRLRCLYRLHRI
jgi:hypothetical protein